MGFGFRVVPGVRLRVSSRGVSAGVGPRIARVNVGSRGGVGLSSGIGPFQTFAPLVRGGGRRSTGSRGLSYAAQNAAAEWEVRRAELRPSD
ncbi:MAG: hypothetical protein QG661_3284 [Actinomycetota bacterium]|nr:hypothetical protein [Actinomycetota bacterium]